MSRNHLLTKSFLGAFFLFLGVQASAWALTGSYHQSISLGGQTVAEFKVTAKGEKVRTEFPGQEDAEIILRNENGTFRYSPAQNVALKMPDALEQESLLDDMDNYTAFLEANDAKQIGEEKVREYDTVVYEFLDPVTQNTAKAWVLKDRGFPVQILVQAPEGELKVELSNIELDGEVDDSLFVVPEGAQIVRLEDLYEQLPQQQEPENV